MLNSTNTDNSYQKILKILDKKSILEVETLKKKEGQAVKWRNTIADVEEAVYSKDKGMRILEKPVNFELNLNSNPDDLIDKLPNNLIQSFIEMRKHVSIFKQEDLKNNKDDSNLLSLFFDNPIPKPKIQTLNLDNLGIYFFYHNIYNEKIPHFQKFQTSDIDLIGVLNKNGDDIFEEFEKIRSLEAIEEVNEFDSQFIFGSDKKSTTSEEICTFVHFEESDNIKECYLKKLSINNNFRKTLQTKKKSVKSSEINLTQNTITFMRNLISKNHSKQKQNFKEKNSFIFLSEDKNNKKSIFSKSVRFAGKTDSKLAVQRLKNNVIEKLLNKKKEKLIFKEIRNHSLSREARQSKKARIFTISAEYNRYENQNLFDLKKKSSLLINNQQTCKNLFLVGNLEKKRSIGMDSRYSNKKKLIKWKYNAPKSARGTKTLNQNPFTKYGAFQSCNFNKLKRSSVFSINTTDCLHKNLGSKLKTLYDPLKNSFFLAKNLRIPEKSKRTINDIFKWNENTHTKKLLREEESFGSFLLKRLIPWNKKKNSAINRSFPIPQKKYKPKDGNSSVLSIAPSQPYFNVRKNIKWPYLRLYLPKENQSMTTFFENFAKLGNSFKNDSIFKFKS